MENFSNFTIEQYTGAWPNKATMTKKEFGDAVEPLQWWWHNTSLSQLENFRTKLNTFVPELEEFAGEIALAYNGLDNKIQEVDENVILSRKWANEDYNIEVANGEYSAKHYANIAQNTLSMLPDGTLNDLISSETTTWSSLKINTTLAQKNHHHDEEYQKKNEAILATKEVKVAMTNNSINLSTGNLFTKTITANTTFTISNVASGGNVNSFILELTNAGAFIITWFSGVKWAGGTAPTLTTSGVDVLGFYSHDGGTTWRGMLLAKDSK